jgi:drug/metabolite transporter (DMT)-like permease
VIVLSPRGSSTILRVPLPDPHARPDRRPTGRDLILLALLTFAWGTNWPVMKLGVAMLPPLWFRALGLALGVLVLAIVLVARRVPLRLPPGTLSTIVWLAIPNVIVWYSVVTIAITMLPAGRAAILGFTMPIWSALIGVLFYRERLDARTIVGVACAAIGIAILVVGAGDGGPDRSLGIALMLIAAIAWAWGTHLFQRARLPMETVAITFWMMVIGCPALFAASAWSEWARWRLPVGLEWWPIVYNAFVVLALGNLLWFTLARTLSPTIAGLSALAIPIVGVLSSFVALDEAPSLRDVAALGLVIAAVGIGLLPQRSKDHP